MSDADLKAWLGFLLIGFVIGALVGSCVGGMVVYSTWERSAVRHNCAEFVITDTTNGETEFRWKDEAP